MRWAIIFVAVSILVGCRPATAPPPTQPTATSQPQREVAAAHKPQPASWVEIPRRKPPRFDRSWREEASFADAVAGDGQAELAASVQQQLELLTQLLVAGSRSERDCAPLADATFTCGELRPATTEALRDSLFTVRRSAGGDAWSVAGDNRGPAGFAKALQKFMTPLATASNLRAEYRLLSLTLEHGKLATPIKLVVAGNLPRGALQISTVWNCQWQLRHRPPKLESITVESFEEVALHGEQPKLFADCTTAVLGKLPAWSQQLARGVDDWRWRREKPLAPAAMGWQGLAVGDVNGDGRDDLYLCYGAGLPNRLLVQNADGTASDVSHSAGVDWLDACTSALIVDLDNDGDQDLIVAGSAELLVHVNDGQGKFELSQAIALPSQSMSLSAADYDADGRLDVFVCGYAPAAALNDSLLGQPTSLLDAAGGGTSKLFHNEDDGSLRDVTAEAGIDENRPAFSLASSWEDYDNDGDVDLFVASAFGPNRLYRNGDGQFRDVAGAAGVRDFGVTTSAGWADFNGDGRMDVFLGGLVDNIGSRILHDEAALAEGGDTMKLLSQSYRGSTLLIADGQSYRAAGPKFQADLTRATWNVRAIDINNDGREDLVAATGIATGVRENDLSDYFWRRIALQSTLADASQYDAAWKMLTQRIHQGSSWSGGQRGVCWLNLKQQSFAEASIVSGLDFAGDGRALATTDWDGDGDLDLWMTSRSAPSIRFANNLGSGRSLMLKLQGVASNRDAIGARVTARLKPSGGRIVKSLRAGDGFLSQSSKWLHFGLPAGEELVDLVVRWPDGREESFAGVQRGGRFLLVEGSGQPQPVAARDKLQLSASGEAIPRPPSDASIFLVSRIPLPAFKYRNFKDESIEFNGATKAKTNTLIYLWSSSIAPSVANLTTLSRDAVSLRLARIEALALAVDEVPTGKLTSTAAHEALRKSEFSFATGMASPQLLDQLDAVQQTLLGLELPLVVPSALLVDQYGRVAAIYRGKLSVQRLIADAKALDHDADESRTRAVGLPGRWRGDPLLINPFALVEKLHAGDNDDVTTAYVQLLIKQGHDRAAGYEQLQPEKLYFMAGQLLQSRKRFAEAAEAYRVVLKVDPQHIAANRQLANIASQLHKYREAADALRSLVEANPDDTALRHEWAVRLADAGDIKASLQQHREVLARQPDSIVTANNLAWLLATHPDPEIRRSDEALQIARRVCEATQYQRPEMLDTLAAAYASAGRISGAVSTARRALELAREQKRSAAQIEAIQLHLQSYEAGEPFFADPKREYWDDP